MSGSNSIPHGIRQSSTPPVDIQKIRSDFPILHQNVYGKPFVYLDNAATSQKPSIVIDAIDHYYREDNSNVHRGLHVLSMRATDAFEAARIKAQRFINAADPCEIVFVRGATEGINLVTNSFGRKNLRAGDEVLVSEMEHHSNIVPWQLLCEEKGAKLRVIPMDDDGVLLIDEYEKLLRPRTKIVAITHVSNALGTINPIGIMTEMAHSRGITVLVDGAQAAPHIAIDVRDLDSDFYVLSGHKAYGPTGIGVLYGKRKLLEAMPPYQGGGDMISKVTFEKTTYNVLPHKFEAGTPDIAGAIGMGEAFDYLRDIGPDAIAAHEYDLLSYATASLLEIEGLRIIGNAKAKAAVISFTLDGVHPHDAGTIIDREGIAVRAGHHCSQPVMDHFELPATTRASFGIYNMREEVDALVAAIHKVKEVFR
jgi:cysteine desulfurase/selenocysteine lyase